MGTLVSAEATGHPQGVPLQEMQCAADYAGDGYVDIYFVNGRDLYHRGISVRNALYHNNGDGTFTDVTDKAGVSGSAYGLGCVWGD